MFDNRKRNDHALKGSITYSRADTSKIESDKRLLSDRTYMNIFSQGRSELQLPARPDIQDLKTEI